MTTDAAREAQALMLSASMSSFVPASSAYVASVVPDFENAVVSIALIQPPVRDPNIPNFTQARALSVLEAIRRGVPLPPVEVDVPPHALGAHTYRLRDGFHRFHLSAVLGFTHLPVVIKPTST